MQRKQSGVVIKSSQLSEVPVPLPADAGRNFKILFKFREGEDEQRLAAWQDRGRSGIADQRRVVVENS